MLESAWSATPHPMRLSAPGPDCSELSDDPFSPPARVPRLVAGTIAVPVASHSLAEDEGSVEMG